MYMLVKKNNKEMQQIVIISESEQGHKKFLTPSSSKFSVIWY
jgi:hypothetical protein